MYNIAFEPITLTAEDLYPSFESRSEASVPFAFHSSDQGEGLGVKRCVDLAGFMKRPPQAQLGRLRHWLARP